MGSLNAPLTLRVIFQIDLKKHRFHILPHILLIHPYPPGFLLNISQTVFQVEKAGAITQIRILPLTNHQCIAQYLKLHLEPFGTTIETHIYMFDYQCIVKIGIVKTVRSRAI